MADNRTWWEKALDALPEYDSTRDFTIKGHKVTTPPNPVDTVLGFGHSLVRNLPRSLDEDFLRVPGDIISGKRDPTDPATFVPFALNFAGMGGALSAVKGAPKGAIASNLLEAPAKVAPKVAKATKQPKTVVAMRHPETDELIIGKPGENHADLMERAGWPQGVDDRQHMGWYNKDTGVYESRSGAAQRLKAEEPEVYEKTPGIQSGRLEANKLTAGRFLASGSSRKLAGDLQDSGGFSVSLRDGSMPDSGYMVGKFPNKDNMVIDGYATPEDIEKFAKRYAQSLGQKDHYLGGWFDPETGKTYLDVSVRYADKDEAIKAGLKTEQLTGYDVKSGDVFNIAKDRTRLKPALAHPTNPERVKIGEPGDTHLGLEADNPDFYAGSAGYVDEMGNFMDRDTAGDFARANPDVFRSPEYRQTFEDNDFLDTTMLWANNKKAAPLAAVPHVQKDWERQAIRNGEVQRGGADKVKQFNWDDRNYESYGGTHRGDKIVEDYEGHRARMKAIFDDPVMAKNFSDNLREGLEKGWLTEADLDEFLGRMGMRYQKQPGLPKPDDTLWENNKNVAPLAAAPLMSGNQRSAPLSLAPKNSDLGKAVARERDKRSAFTADYTPGWLPPGSTVLGDKGFGDYPGVFKQTDEIVEDALAAYEPEHPALKEVFGVTRSDLADIGRKGKRVGEDKEPYFGYSEMSPRASIRGIMIPENEQRILNVLSGGSYARTKPFQQFKSDVDAWYITDPMFWELEKLVGRDAAIKHFDEIQKYGGFTSINASPMEEVNRATAGRYLNKRDRLHEFKEWGGVAQQDRPSNFPADLVDFMPNIRTPAQYDPMLRYSSTGDLSRSISSAKAPLYIGAKGVPGVDPRISNQTRWMIPDAHQQRASGATNVRGDTTKVNRAQSANAKNYMPQGVWWADEIAAPLGIEPVPAQSRSWALFGPQTGVKAKLGAPYLEFWARRIKNYSDKYNVPIEAAKERVLLADAIASNPKTAAPFSLAPPVREDE